MWWPSPEAFEDLSVEDVEGGFTLSAPPGSECAAWLSYWNQSPEHEEFFSKEFQHVLIEHLNNLTHGETQVQSHQ